MERAGDLRRIEVWTGTISARFAAMNVDELLLNAVEKLTPAERAAYLDRVCGNDIGLRRKLEGLLHAHEHAHSFLEGSLFDSPATIDHDSMTEPPGTQIGPYKLMEQIGEGGMGVV